MDKLSFFKNGTSRICGSLDIHEALHDCLLFLQGFMPLNCILFGLFEEEIDALRILALAADFPVKSSVDTAIALSAESQAYRINVVPIRIPPLRERKADIPALVYHFIERKCREMNLRRQPVLAEGMLERLKLYDWPGNVRELENAVERELIRSLAAGRGGSLRFDEIGLPAAKPQQESTLPGSPHGTPDLALDAVLRAHITYVLSLTKGRVQGPRGAAALLGVQPNTLRHRMRRLGIPYGVRLHG